MWSGRRIGTGIKWLEGIPFPRNVGRKASRLHGWRSCCKILWQSCILRYYFCLVIFTCIVHWVTTGGSWSGTLGGALTLINDEVTLDLPLWMLGPLPLLILVGSEPLGDLFTLLVSPSGWGLGLFGERWVPDLCCYGDGGVCLIAGMGWHSKDNSCLPLASWECPPHVPSQGGVSLPLLHPGPLFGYGQYQQFPPLHIKCVLWKWINQSWLSFDHDTLEFCQFVPRHLNAIGFAPAPIQDPLWLDLEYFSGAIITKYIWVWAQPGHSPIL